MMQAKCAKDARELDDFPALFTHPSARGKHEALWRLIRTCKLGLTILGIDPSLSKLPWAMQSPVCRTNVSLLLTPQGTNLIPEDSYRLIRKLKYKLHAGVCITELAGIIHQKLHL